MKKKIATPSRQQLKPLREFNFGVVQERLTGLLTNTDRDLQRRTDVAAKRGDERVTRQFITLTIAAKFVRNSYHAALYLTADTPEDHTRQPSYVLLLPTINRQMFDLLFSVIYMLDDFPTRMILFERAGWREGLEETERYRRAYGNDVEWTAYLSGRQAVSERLKELFGITKQERANLKLIAPWPTPTQMLDKKTKSREFLRWMYNWLYKDTSQQAHLSSMGMFMISPFLLSEIVQGEDKRLIEERIIKQYRYIHFSRTALAALAVCTELNTFFRLGNDERISYLWGVFREHSEDAKDMLKRRYERFIAPDGR